MNSLARISKLPRLFISRRLALQTSIPMRTSVSHPYGPPVDRLKPEDLKDMDPENYSLPLRPPTMDDLMEPYGSWKTAYENERSYANKQLGLGVLCFGITCLIFIYSGVLDPLYMPNLDNLMEDTKPFDRKNDR